MAARSSPARSPGHPLLILNSIGAKSGQERRAILTCSRDGGDYVVAGTAGGSPTTPGLGAQPRGARRRDDRGATPGLQARAPRVIPSGPERDRLWDQHVAVLPNFADYPEQSGRLIPMIRLTPAAARADAAARDDDGIIGRCATARSRRSSHTHRGCSTSATASRSIGRRPATRTASPRSRSMADPAAAAQPGRRRWFDPDRYRLVQLDQRGCGRSTPHAGDLDDRPVDQHDPPPDRRHRAAARAPGDRAVARVGRVVGRDARARVRRAVPRARDRDGPALDHDDAARRRALAGARDRPLLPRAVGAVPRCRAGGRSGRRPGGGLRPAAERHRRIPRSRIQASLDWTAWEDAILSLEEGYEVPHPRWADEPYRIAFARLVTHYFSHAAWLEEDELLRNAHRLAGIPAVLSTAGSTCPARPTSRGSSPRRGPDRSSTSSPAATPATPRWTAGCSRPSTASEDDPPGA